MRLYERQLIRKIADLRHVIDADYRAAQERARQPTEVPAAADWSPRQPLPCRAFRVSSTSRARRPAASASGCAYV